MLKKIVIASVALGLVAGLGLFFWANAILGSEAVRSAVATQLTKVLGQPVQVGGIGASILPRVTMTLENVTVGDPARIALRNVHVGAGIRALLSKRIEHAVVRVNGARIELPLPPLMSAGTRSEPTGPAGPSIQIVSIDEIKLTDVDMVSGARTLHGEVDIAPAPVGVEVRRIALTAGDTSIDISGTIADLTGPVGELAVKARGLDVPALVAFLSDFSSGAGRPNSSAPRANVAPSATSSTMNVSATIEADKAVFGTLALERVRGRARITGTNIAVEPATFEVFDGKYDGTLQLTLNDAPQFTLVSSVSGVDMGAVARFAGRPDSMAGRLSGRIDVTGRVNDVASSTHGRARVDATDGAIKGLGLVRGIVLATSTRGDSVADIGSTTVSEPFSKMGGTFAIAGGSASTEDLVFESKDLRLSGKGGFRLDGTAIKVESQVQLSAGLSAQAGRDLVRYTQENGRVTLPVTVDGTLGSLSVRVNVGSLAKRAITNRATEEANKAIKKGLGGLLGR